GRQQSGLHLRVEHLAQAGLAEGEVARESAGPGVVVPGALGVGEADVHLARRDLRRHRLVAIDPIRRADERAQKAFDLARIGLRPFAVYVVGRELPFANIVVGGAEIVEPGVLADKGPGDRLQADVDLALEQQAMARAGAGAGGLRDLV